MELRTKFFKRKSGYHATKRERISLEIPTSEEIVHTFQKMTQSSEKKQSFVEMIQSVFLNWKERDPVVVYQNLLNLIGIETDEQKKIAQTKEVQEPEPCSFMDNKTKRKVNKRLDKKYKSDNSESQENRLSEALVSSCLRENCPKKYKDFIDLMNILMKHKTTEKINCTTRGSHINIHTPSGNVTFVKPHGNSKNNKVITTNQLQNYASVFGVEHRK